MIFSRITRGASRTAVLVGLKLEHIAHARPRFTANTVRKVAFQLLALRLVTSFIPAHAAIPAALAADDTDPSPIIPLVAGTVPVSVSLNPAALQNGSDTLFVGSETTLASVTVGQSNATVQAEQAAAQAAQQATQQAAAAAAQQAAQQQAAAQKAAAAKAAQVQAAAVSSVQHNTSVDTEYDAWFQEYFGSDWRIARAIGEAESGLNPSKISHTNDYGVMQIHNGLASFGPGIFDPETNIRIAAQHYWANRGFQPWTTYRDGAYLHYM